MSCAQLKQCAYEGFDRDRWQKPQRVIESLDLRPGSTVADLGAGSGYFTFKLARAVGPAGKVYAVDIDADMIGLIAERAKKAEIPNIEPIRARADDPLLPLAAIDLILSVNTYHHIENRPAYFTKLRRYLTPDGRVAIIDLDRRAWLENLMGHTLPRESIKREMEQAGYVLEREFDFLDRQSFSVFAPAP